MDTEDRGMEPSEGRCGWMTRRSCSKVVKRRRINGTIPRATWVIVLMAVRRCGYSGWWAPMSWSNAIAVADDGGGGHQ